MSRLPHGIDWYLMSLSSSWVVLNALGLRIKGNERLNEPTGLEIVHSASGGIRPFSGWPVSLHHDRSYCFGRPRCTRYRGNEHGVSPLNDQSKGSVWYQPTLTQASVGLSDFIRAYVPVVLQNINSARHSSRGGSVSSAFSKYPRTLCRVRSSLRMWFVPCLYLNSMTWKPLQG